MVNHFQNNWLIGSDTLIPPGNKDSKKTHYNAYKYSRYKHYECNTVIPCTGMYALKPKYLEIDAALNTLFGHYYF